ncbi:MAG: FAD-dependent monooxygenase [Oscillospiraceae bacterium]|nr:FAD-dependent monooxygenase [Oscillospiraceae bacterium]
MRAVQLKTLPACYYRDMWAHAHIVMEGGGYQMLRVPDLALPLDYTEEMLRKAAARAIRCKPNDITAILLARRAVDARRQVQFIITADATVKNETELLKKLPKNTKIKQVQPYQLPHYEKKTSSKRPVIIGAGPAGLFAAWILAKAGLQPIVLERGKQVSERQKAVSEYYLTGKLDPECNVQFGEGGAGTFSDGKLNTGTKSVHIRQVLQIFTDCGAPEEILWQAKPHIGTDRLAECIPALRRCIEAEGGTVHFQAKCTGITLKNGQIVSVEYVQNGTDFSLETSHVILAVGHSARDVFQWLSEMQLPMEQKAFSLGVRIEHLQRDMNRICYGSAAEHPALGAASYQVAAHLPDGRGIYSFCMCPGGVVQAAASEAETVVTNGMSCFARDAENANSAILVGITPEDFGSDEILAGVELQRKIEHAAYVAGGCTGKAPAILLGDFLKNQQSAVLGNVAPSYPLGTVFARPETCLPETVCQALRAGIPLLDQRLHGFLQKDAVMTAPETRSSSPVRILRNPETLEALTVKGLYPCGEGAGYAGGIMSAAVDGIRCAEKILADCH